MALAAQILFILLTAGVITANYFETTLKVGDTLSATVATGNNPDVPCYLKPPKGDAIEFRPENHSTDRITYSQTNFISYCGANIVNLTEEDDGEWTIYYINGTERVGNTYNLIVTKENNAEENAEPESESVEEEVDTTQWLEDINISTRTGLTVDISLSKKELEETFTIITPQNVVEQVERVNIPGVKVHGSSNFVASRISIGPMDESLLGRWTLCGEEKTDKTVKRCQSVAISWNNRNNPSAGWYIDALQKRDTVTNYLATVTTGVSNSGTMMTCHLVTPSGEDLIITKDSDFPGISRVPTQDSGICRVNIGPIHKELLGDWTLYASFRSFFGDVTEMRLPLHMFLYDENDPYKQAYNVTNLEPLTRVINLGTSITLEIPGTGETDSCEVKSPSGQTFDLQKSTEPVTFLETSLRVSCAVTIGPIGQETLGDWEIISKFNNRGIYTENRQALLIVQEDPTNPIMEDHRTIVNRDMIFFDTAMGAEHIVVGDRNSIMVTIESCHLRTPSGLQYTLMDGFNIPGIEVIEYQETRCGIKINVVSEDLIGEWTLISRELRFSDAMEVRHPFTIFVQKNVNASASKVTVTEGNNLHLRLAKPTNLHDTCKLYDNTGTERTDHEVDASEVDTCGFIVKNVKNDDSGIWQIRYGTGISYRADIEIVVKDLWESTHDTIKLSRGRSVNKTIGPETAVYCKLTDPSEQVVYEGHGRCILALERVTSEHAGTWVMNVGLLGNMITRTYHITAEVKGSEDKPIVTTYVAKEQPEVTLECSVPVEYEVQSCLFREPSGRVIIVNHGVAEDRYISHGSGTNVDGNVTTHECGLRIANPVASDLGLWRCAVNTDHETYYGFLSVLCPWAMQDPITAAAVVSEPTLTAHKPSITHIEGDSLTMSCSIQAPIQYCYFRRPNGMTYSVTPGHSSPEFEYVGAGLDAGECGIRISALQQQGEGHWPEGRWSCHVGLANDTQPDRRADIQVQIIKPIEVNQYLSKNENYRVLMVQADVYQQQPLEYCRYVRIDGVGFKSTSPPDSRYSSYEDLTRGHCGINILDPTVLDLHPWTVAAKIVGKDEEVLGITNHTIERPAPPVLRVSYVWWWFSTIFTGLFLVCLGILLIPPKNRRNTISRANSWRNSIRTSFSKKPLPADDGSRTTPTSA